MSLRKAVSGLSNLQQAALILLASVLPPILALLGAQSTNPFFYGTAILGGILAFAIKMLGTPDMVVSVALAASVVEQPKTKKTK